LSFLGSHGRSEKQKITAYLLPLRTAKVMFKQLYA